MPTPKPKLVDLLTVALAILSMLSPIVRARGVRIKYRPRNESVVQPVLDVSQLQIAAVHFEREFFERT